MTTENHENPFAEAPVEELASDAPRERMASEKQEAFIQKLIGERDTDQLGPDELLLARKREHTFNEARTIIDVLLQLPVVDRDPPEGIHFINDTVYKVQVAHQGSGKKYAKKLIVGSEQGADGWLYVGRDKTFHQLSDDTLMTLEQAKKFGRLYGMCCVCGATLTDETSIERGIGPICEGRL